MIAIKIKVNRPTGFQCMNFIHISNCTWELVSAVTVPLHWVNVDEQCSMHGNSNCRCIRCALCSVHMRCNSHSIISNGSNSCVSSICLYDFKIGLCHIQKRNALLCRLQRGKEGVVEDWIISLLICFNAFVLRSDRIENLYLWPLCDRVSAVYFFQFHSAEAPLNFDSTFKYFNFCCDF